MKKFTCSMVLLMILFTGMSLAQNKTAKHKNAPKVKNEIVLNEFEKYAKDCKYQGIGVGMTDKEFSALGLSKTYMTDESYVLPDYVHIVHIRRSGDAIVGFHVILDRDGDIPGADGLRWWVSDMDKKFGEHKYEDGIVSWKFPRVHRIIQLDTRANSLEFFDDSPGQQDHYDDLFRH